MARRITHREVPETHRASEHLDNERTFLAWVRTNIALIGLGFVVARLSPTLGSAAGADGARIATRAVPAGVALIILGAVVTVLAAWRFDRVNQQIETGRVAPDRGLVWSVTVVISLLTAGAVIYTIMRR